MGKIWGLEPAENLLARSAGTTCTTLVNLPLILRSVESQRRLTALILKLTFNLAIMQSSALMQRSSLAGRSTMASPVQVQYRIACGVTADSP